MRNGKLLHCANFEMNALYDGSIEPDGVTGVWESRSLCIITMARTSLSTANRAPRDVSPWRVRLSQFYQY